MRKLFLTLGLVVLSFAMLQAQVRRELKTTDTEAIKAQQEKRASPTDFQMVTLPDGRQIRYVKPVMPSLLPEDQRVIYIKRPVKSGMEIEGVDNRENISEFATDTVDLGTLNLGRVIRIKPE